MKHPAPQPHSHRISNIQLTNGNPDHSNNESEKESVQEKEKHRYGSFTTKRSSGSQKSTMKLPTFTQKTNTNTSTNTDLHSRASTLTRSSHKRTPSASSSTSSSAPTFRRKSTSHSPRTSFSRRSVSQCRRSPEHRRQNYRYPLAIKPRLAGVYTPSLPPELWAEILRFAGAVVDRDADYVDVGPLSSSSPPSGSAVSSSFSTPAPTSFLTYQQSHAHLSARLERYNSGLKFKVGLTRVCRLFHWLAQEVLYEHVWIGKRKEGRMLAGRLCGDGGVGSAWGPAGDWGVYSVISSGTRKVKKDGKGIGKLKGKTKLFGWFNRRKTVDGAVSPPTPVITTGPKTRMRTTSSSSSSSVSPFNVNVGHFIRRLHIETPSLDKCSPHDLLIILQYCTRLEEFFDYRSVQRPMHPLALSASDVVPFSSFTTISSPSPSISSSSASSSSQAPANSDYHHQHRLLTPDALLHTLFSRPLKRLSWTNYDHHPMDVVRGVQYYENIVGPRLVLDGVGKGLEFLEISMSCSEVLFGSGGGVGWIGQESVWGVQVGASFANSPSTGINSMLLTEMTASYTTTTSFSSLSTTSSSSSPALSSSFDGHIYTLVLPSLLSLKVTLDNATFTALAKWDMPRLTHLSVMLADFGYAAEGFRLFFEVHGWKILQLELGHSSEDIEEAWVTSRPSRTQLNPLGQPQTTNQMEGPFSIPLDQWCPALQTFICSADAEWNWQSPDWIAPHVLLPTHAGLEVIGVRDMERRLKGDANDAASRRRADAGVRMGDRDGELDEDDPYFMLFEQFGSLLRKEAFPNLKYIRDMSQESDVIRRSGHIDLNSTTFASLPSSALSTLTPDPQSHGLVPTLSPPTSPQASSGSPSVHTSVSVLTKPRKLSQAAQIAKKDQELAREQGRRVIRFWASVLEECAKRGVNLLDWNGEEVLLHCFGTPRHL